METSRIRIFESISLLSKLIPYYGSSHIGYLLLSLLSKNIRCYLLEHYPKYRRFMLKYAKMIKYKKDKHLEMKLPLDLFKFSTLYVHSEEDTEFLVGLIHKLTNKEGLYFGEHYMSDQICFEKIYVYPKYIPALHPHIESLTSIKVFPFEEQNLILHHSFLNLIVLCDIFDCDELKDCFFIGSELKKISPIYKSFKRIDLVYFRNYKEAFARLITLKQASIQEIEVISFGDMNEKDFDRIINLILNYKIHTLNYAVSCELISSQVLENISKINPQKLYLPYLNSISSLSWIFLHLREDINIFFGSIYELDPLNFEKTVVLFKTKDDIVKAYCDKISFTFKTKLNQENILFLENYVCISNLKTIKVENFKKENVTTKTPIEGLLLDDLKNESCILIPRNNLSCVKLKLCDISYLFENETHGTNFKALSSKTKIIIKLSSMRDLAELNKLKKYFPEHSELTINYFHTGINNTNFVESLLLSILSKFKLTSLVVISGDKDEDIFMQLLQMPSIQETLEHFDILKLDISKCTSVIDLFVEFKRINTIRIECKYSKDDKLEELKIAIKKFKKKLRKTHPEIEIDIRCLKG